MKNLILIGGTMGAGKTATARALAKILPHNVLLDGDWCWTMTPFVVTEETKALCMDNITSLLRNDLACNAFENVIFCWVMHQQSILDELLSRLDLRGVRVLNISLVLSAASLRARLENDVARGLRTADVIARSIPRIALYDALDTIKIDVSDISAEEAAAQIAVML